MNKLIKVLIVTFGFVSSAFASNTEPTETEVQRAQQKLQASYSNITVVDFNPSPIPGIYEVNMGTGIVYFHPEKQLLLFGEIFNSSGESLTAASLKKGVARKLENTDFSSALVIGDPDGVEIIEFTDPDCPYCRRYDQFIQAQNTPIKRKLVFDIRVHPQAAAKVEHILCSEDQEKAYKAIYSGQPVELLACDEGKDLLKKHAAISKSVGVSGTPSLILDGRLVTGFRQGVITDYLRTQQKMAAK